MCAIAKRIELDAFLIKVFEVMDQTELMRMKQTRSKLRPQMQIEANTDEMLTSILKEKLRKLLEGLPDKQRDLLGRHHELICSPSIQDWPTYFFKLRQLVESSQVGLNWKGIQRHIDAILIANKSSRTDQEMDDPELVDYLDSNLENINEKSIGESKARLESAIKLGDIVRMCTSSGIDYDHVLWQEVEKMNPKMAKKSLFNIYIQALDEKARVSGLKDKRIEARTSSSYPNSVGREPTEYEKESTELSKADAIRLIILLAKNLPNGKWFARYKLSNGSNRGENKWGDAWDFVEEAMGEIPGSIRSVFPNKKAFQLYCYRASLPSCQINSVDKKENSWAYFRSQLLSSKYLSEYELRLIAPESGPRSGG